MNKKGLSEIISYVLLILIAVGLSAGIYVGLKAYVPREQVACPESISVVINGVECNSADNKITITFQNRGFFNVDGAYIYGATDSGGFSQELIPDSINTPGFFYFHSKLTPNDEDTHTFIYSDSISRIQVKPFIINEKVKDKIVICEQSVISQRVSGCN